MPIYLQHGNLIDYVPPTDTSPEDVVFMGGLVGIPQTFIPAGELGALSVDGVYIFNKKDGVSVNLGDVVKYCGTTKLAQDSNADLTLGVAVADAEADDYGVKVKINSVLPSSGGGGGGGGGEVSLCGDSGLYFDGGGRVAIKYRDCSAIKADEDGVYLTVCSCSAIKANGDGVYIAVCTTSGLSIQNGELVASGGGGGGGEVAVSCGLAFNDNGQLYVSTGCGLDFNSDGGLIVSFAPGCGIDFNEYGQLVATSEVAIDTTRGLSETSRGIGINIGSGLSFDCGQLVATGGGGGEISTGCGLYFTDDGQLVVSYGGGLNFNNSGQLMLKVCTASGLSIDNDGYLVYNG